MTEATWGENAKTPEINWRMSASLENVSRSANDVAEVTSLERVVREWCALEPQHQAAAVVTVEHPVQIDGAFSTTFTGNGIAALADHLPAVDQAEE